MKNEQRPIGIFDSGIGGLTVANAIRKVLPHESFIYFGDTAHLPYGDKSPESIRGYALRITRFLLERRCKAIVIACNTASAHAYKEVVRLCGSEVPVINVIDPVARHTAERFDHGQVGVIGTKGTIQSRVYVQRIERLNPRLKVISNATPLLAPMIEEGFFNNQISRTIIRNYLERPNFKKIRAIILGCTHYPLIAREIREITGVDVDIIDSARVVAGEVKTVLSARHLLNPSASAPSYRFYVSDKTAAFEKSTRIFFREQIKLEKSRIWERG
ncbi:MAG: glutamate racemase [Flavobacteriales bacterium]|jgi:glutamate racemase